MNSFYSLYRPKTFDNVIGQELIKKILINSINKNQISHAYLIHGIRGVGKTTIARIYSKLLNCNNVKNDSPCNECSSCRSIDSSSSLSVIEFDAATNNGVDDIRDIIDKSKYSTVDKYKIYIIDEVHMLSKAAFNALLKTLEEPPKNTIFMLLTTEMERIPDTIISRCLILNLESLSKDQIKLGLQSILNSERISYTEKALSYILDISSGSLRDSISLLQAISLSDNKITEETVCKALRIESTEKLSSLIKDRNKEELLKLFDNNHIDINNLIKILINLLTQTITKDNDPIYKTILNSILIPFTEIKDSEMLRIYIKNTINNIFSKDENVSRETIKHLEEEKDNKLIEEEEFFVSQDLKKEEIQIKEEIIEEVEIETKNFKIKETFTEKETILEKTPLPQELNLVREEQEKDIQTQEHNINKLFENNVSRETIKTFNKKTPPITDFINIKHYLTVLSNNNTTTLDLINQRWMRIKDFYDSEYKEIVKVLMEVNKIIAAMEGTLVIGFADEHSAEEFKNLSTSPKLFELIEKVLGNKTILLPVHKNNWEQLLTVYKEQFHNTGKKINERLNIDEILSKIEKDQDIGLMLFGDKLK